VERLRPIAAELVAEALSTLRRVGSGDLAAALAHVPMHVMCSLLGVPTKAVPDFIAWVNALSPAFGLMTPAQIVAAEAAITELLDYVRDLVDQRSHATADDLVSGLIRAEHDGERLTRDRPVGHRSGERDGVPRLHGHALQPGARQVRRHDAGDGRRDGHQRGVPDVRAVHDVGGLWRIRRRLEN
jgi:hypothetical protein